jgi:two-component system, LytTR family, sensor kinase
VVNAFLILVFLLTGPLPGFYNYPWFVWVMAGWGIGLMFHYFGVFVYGKPSQSNFRQQLIEEELRRMGVNPPGEPPPR